MSPHHIIKRPPTSVDHLLFPIHNEASVEHLKGLVKAYREGTITEPHEEKPAKKGGNRHPSVYYIAPKEGGKERHHLQLVENIGEKPLGSSLHSTHFDVIPEEKDGHVVFKVIKTLGDSQKPTPEEVKLACNRLAHFSDYVPHPSIEPV